MFTAAAFSQWTALPYTVTVRHAPPRAGSKEASGHGHGHTLYEEMLHVPFLVLRTDAVPHTRVIDMPVAQVDILPTIAELVGAPIPAAAAGRSLAATIVAGVEPSPRAILSEMDNRGRPVWNAKKGDPEADHRPSPRCFSVRE